MDNKKLHEILLKKAREAEYNDSEKEYINFQTETFFIGYYLEREINKELENIQIAEEKLKEVYDENKVLYKSEQEFKIDTIFVKDIKIASDILREVNPRNFEALKKKYDEKENTIENPDEFIGISRIFPQIATAILKSNKKGIVKDVAYTMEGAHIILIKDIKNEKQATYEEAKSLIEMELRRTIYDNLYNELINKLISENEKSEINN